jgi:hypothetical protein
MRDSERSAGSVSRQVFVVLKGHRCGQPLSAARLAEIPDSARARPGLARAACHQLRHPASIPFEAGMALEGQQAAALPAARGPPRCAEPGPAQPGRASPKYLNRPEIAASCRLVAAGP